MRAVALVAAVALALLAPADPAPAGPARQACEPLTDAELVAQVIGAPLRAPDPDATAITLAAEHAGTVVLLGDAIESAEQVRGLVAALDAVANPPPLVAVDEEGGRVARFGRSGVATHLPSARDQAASATPEQVADAAAGLGAEMAALGVDWDLAPVLDLTDAPADGVIGDRSYGTDPAVVGAYGAAFAEGLRRAGLVTAGKHFPDHGLTTTDTHQSVAEVTVAREALATRHLEPYRRALPWLDAIMLSHLRVSSLDPSLPASLSAEAVRFLRAELGFDGAVVTDDLSMAAVAAVADQARAAVMAVSAGADVVLAGDPAGAADAHAALLSALGDGSLPRERLRRAVRRALDLKGVQGAAASCLLGLPTVAEAAAVVGADGVAHAVADGARRRVPDPQTLASRRLEPVRYADDEIATLPEGPPLPTVRRFAPVVVAAPGGNPLDVAVARAVLAHGPAGADRVVVTGGAEPWRAALAASWAAGAPVLPPGAPERVAAALEATTAATVDALGAVDRGGRPGVTIAQADPVAASLAVLERGPPPATLLLADPRAPAITMLAGWVADPAVGVLYAGDPADPRVNQRVAAHDGPVVTLGTPGPPGAEALPVDPAPLLHLLALRGRTGRDAIVHASVGDLMAALPLAAATRAVPVPTGEPGPVGPAWEEGLGAWRLPGGATRTAFAVGVEPGPLAGLGMPRTHQRR